MYILQLIDFPHFLLADETLYAVSKRIYFIKSHIPRYSTSKWNGIVLMSVDAGKQVGGIQLDSSQIFIDFKYCDV